VKVGDLVKSRHVVLLGCLGLVMEAEEDDQGVPGHWVEYFEDRGNWRWYSFDECYDVEVISETR